MRRFFTALQLITWIFVLFFESDTWAGVYYIRPGGTGKGTGPTFDLAWGQIAQAFKKDAMQPGDTLYIAPGRYEETNLGPANSGTNEMNRIVILGDPGSHKFPDLPPGEVILGRIQVFRQSFITLENFTLEPMLGDALYGIVVGSCESLVIRSIVIRGFGKPGIHFERFGTDPPASNILIENNELFNNGGGIRLYHGEAILAKNTIIRQNVIKNVEGIWSDIGILVGNASGTQVLSNTVQGGKNGGALVVESIATDVVVHNNIFWAYEHGIVNVDSQSGFVSDYNLFYHIQGGPIGDWNGQQLSTLSDWQTASGQELNSIVADPLFINFGKGDFHLQASSPAIDAGIDVGLSFIGAAPDIGAFEFGLATSVKDSEKQPQKFNLYQNYPNPFNPETKIVYELPGHAQVTITVFDILGREVATVVNEQKSAGAYEVVWDGKNSSGEDVASGIYLYTFRILDIQSGQTFLETKKMILIH